MLADHAEFHVNINSVVGGGFKDPNDALVIGKRALELGFESTIGIIHDGDGQLKPLKPDEAKVYFEMTDRKKTNYAQFDAFQASDCEGRENDWRCRAGSRYLYICEDGLVHYCSQQRGYPGVPLAEYTTADVKREFLTAKSCAPNCTIGCVHRISYIDHWRAPQTTHSLARPGRPGADPARGLKAVGFTFLADHLRLIGHNGYRSFAFIGPFCAHETPVEFASKAAGF